MFFDFLTSGLCLLFFSPFFLFYPLKFALMAVAPILVMAAPFILIGLVVAAVVFGIILAIQHWGQIVAWLQGIWGAFSGWYMGLWNGLSAWFTGMWTGIINGLIAAWNFIVNVIKIGALLALAVIFAPFILIGALFIWLYQHNTYFKMLVDAIVGFFVGCFNWLKGAWTDSINWLVGAWNGLVSFARALWGQISGAIQTGFSVAIGFVSAIWGRISRVSRQRW
jgi:hypothetical protein